MVSGRVSWPREVWDCRDSSLLPAGRAYLERGGASHPGPGAGARVTLTWVPPMVVPSFGEETGLAARGLGGRRGGGLGGPEQAGHLRPSAGTERACAQGASLAVGTGDDESAGGRLGLAAGARPGPPQGTEVRQLQASHGVPRLYPGP